MEEDGVPERIHCSETTCVDCGCSSSHECHRFDNRSLEAAMTSYSFVGHAVRVLSFSFNRYLRANKTFEFEDRYAPGEGPKEAPKVRSDIS